MGKHSSYTTFILQYLDYVTDSYFATVSEHILKETLPTLLTRDVFVLSRSWQPTADAPVMSHFKSNCCLQIADKFVQCPRMLVRRW